MAPHASDRERLEYAALSQALLSWL
ncbi:MAG: hypothetical protein LZF60_160153 [Nitrospira sp.]|nr:MAG: hypothetical protein LZF60_160153 [Nitrospira sp.]